MATDDKKHSIPKDVPWIYSDDKSEAERVDLRQEGKLKEGEPEFEKEVEKRAFIKLMTRKHK
ncbi:MAG: hypothetical protein ABFD98_05470 [Syntrophobacteraceae bacterium]